MQYAAPGVNRDIVSAGGSVDGLCGILVVLLRRLAQTVDDPAISEWLQNGDVVIHPRGFNRDPLSPHLYLDPGETVDEGCQWHTRLSLQGGDPGPRVARTLATNYGTCERLVIEGVSPR